MAWAAATAAGLGQDGFCRRPKPYSGRYGGPAFVFTLIGKQRGQVVRRNVCELLRLQLVQPAAIDPALGKHGRRANAVEDFPGFTRQRRAALNGFSIQRS